MDSKKLEILITAVDLGSFSKAAEVVGYTQSGLTHLVDSLEREIGLTLVQRGHSGVSLTKDGEALMPAIREFLRANARLENQISAITEKSAQTIRIAAYASIAMRWMPEILYRFRRVRRAAERLRLRLDAAAQRRDVRHPAGGLPHGRARDVPDHGIRGPGLSDALRPV